MTAEPRPTHRPEDANAIRSWESPAPAPAGGESQLRLRLAELEAENFRLQRLVSELLIKNQQLRELLCQ